MMTGNWTCLGTFGAGCAVYRCLLPVTSKTRQPFVCVTMTSGKVTMGTEASGHGTDKGMQCCLKVRLLHMGRSGRSTDACS